METLMYGVREIREERGPIILLLLLLQINADKMIVTVCVGRNGSKDIFSGIRYTLEHLHFRPGVSKTVILFLCSHCQPQDMGVS
jgi:hypothetical protein